MGRITKIQQNNGSTYDLGATFDNVVFDYEYDPDLQDNTKRFTLKDFYDYFKELLNKTSFVMYSEKETKDSNTGSVDIWYEVKTSAPTNEQNIGQTEQVIEEPEGQTTEPEEG